MTFFCSERDPTTSTGCEHCPPGVLCDPSTGACINGNYSLLVCRNKCLTSLLSTPKFDAKETLISLNCNALSIKKYFQNLTDLGKYGHNHNAAVTFSFSKN